MSNNDVTLKMVLELMNGKSIKCPKCNKGELGAPNGEKRHHFFKCTNPKCDEHVNIT